MKCFQNHTRKALNFIVAQSVDTVLEAALNPVTENNPVIYGDIPKDIPRKSKKPELRQ